MKSKILLLILISVFISCTKEADIDVPDSQKKPVITCFISPDEPQLSVRISISVPRFGKDSSQQKDIIVNDADVSLNSIQRQIHLVYDRTSGIYTAAEDTAGFLRPGFIYTLSVNTPSFGIITATTQIPMDFMRCDSITTSAYNKNMSSVRLNAFLSGPVQEYNRMAMVLTSQVFNLDTISSPLDTLLFSTEFINYFDEEGVLKKKSFRISNDVYIYNMDTSIQHAVLKSELTVMQCDTAFFAYHKSLNLAYENNGNPFSDPVMIYSNIKGGLGCFGAYRVKRYNFRKSLK